LITFANVQLIQVGDKVHEMTGNYVMRDGEELEYIEYIGKGGYGEVHKVRLQSTFD